MIRRLIVFLLLFKAIVARPGEGLSGGGVFSVKYKFAGMDPSLSALVAHDSLRHHTMMAAAGVDIPLGGTGRPDSVGLYYAKIGIGTPSKDYYVQVDTGSDIMWVNCIQCKECPKRGYNGLELTLFNPADSLTGELVHCDDQFCTQLNRGPVSDCVTNMSCIYTELYGDGSFSIGYFVKDVVIYDRVSGDLETKSANGSVIFGCGGRESGDLGSADEALDGVIGFGKSNSSMISQLASSGKVKKMFAHCLDGINGGGIFAIGHVVEPKVNTTPLVPNQPHYNVNMTGIEVGHDFLSLPRDVFGMGKKKGTIIDSGTTLAYLPEVIYQALVTKIMSWQPYLRLQTLHDQYTCFDYSGSVDDGFPAVILHFENSLSLKVYPHEYLFPSDGVWCIGWQNSGTQTRDRSNMTLLGDLVLSNKLVVYDLESQAIGWTEYNYSLPVNSGKICLQQCLSRPCNAGALCDELCVELHFATIEYFQICSSSIMIRDEMTGSVHLVGAHYLTSSAWTLSSQGAIFFLLIIFLL